MENNNGRGIFYGVIGVATLIVAIIGATFAYFAASTNSANNAINTSSSNVSNLGLTEVKDGIKTNLIPVNETDVKFKTVVGLTKDKCKDLNGNDICSTYQFTVTNPNATAQQVYFYFEPAQNTFTNLHYAVFKGTPTEYDVTGEAVTDNDRSAGTGALVVGDTQLTLNDTTRKEWTSLSQVLPANNGSATYTVVLWIHEDNSDQTATDAGKAFAAGIRVATGQVGQDGTITSGGVTGVLSAS